MIRFPKPAAFKKFAPPTLVPTAVALVGFLLPGASRAAVSSAADLAPIDTLVFLGLPDPVHTFTAMPASCACAVNRGVTTVVRPERSGTWNSW